MIKNLEKATQEFACNEIWKDIEGYEGLYQVSNMGRLKSLNFHRSGKEKLLKQTIDEKGYLKVNLCKGGNVKTYRVHCLVALAFIPNPDGLEQINHRNEQKTNNCVENLEWCTQEYNNNYGTRTERAAAKLKKKVVCVETGQIYDSAMDVLDINNSNIAKCCKGQRKTAGGYHWQYVEVA